MKIIRDKINITELKEMAQKSFGNMVKAVVDVNRQVLAVDADLHSDEESLLLEDGSSNYDLWGINIYPELKNEEYLEFDSMINLRPGLGNRTRGIEDPNLREKIIKIMDKLVLR